MQNFIPPKMAKINYRGIIVIYLDVNTLSQVNVNIAIFVKM